MQLTSLIGTSVECPQCGKHSVVSHKEGVYHCLNCGFERRLDPAEESQESEESPVLASLSVVVFVLTLLLFL
jgi:ribosomal protein L37AE/L43A